MFVRHAAASMTAFPPTTDIHLPRRIGTALKRALHGTLDTHFDDAGYFVRVTWRPTA